jgi:hypothetical protein
MSTGLSEFDSEDEETFGSPRKSPLTLNLVSNLLRTATEFDADDIQNEMVPSSSFITSFIYLSISPFCLYYVFIIDLSIVCYLRFIVVFALFIRQERILREIGEDIADIAEPTETTSFSIRSGEITVPIHPNNLNNNTAGSSSFSSSSSSVVLSAGSDSPASSSTQQHANHIADKTMATRDGEKNRVGFVDSETATNSSDEYDLKDGKLGFNFRLNLPLQRQSNASNDNNTIEDQALNEIEDLICFEKEFLSPRNTPSHSNSNPTMPHSPKSSSSHAKHSEKPEKAELLSPRRPSLHVRTILHPPPHNAAATSTTSTSTVTSSTSKSILRSTSEQNQQQPSQTATTNSSSSTTTKLTSPRSGVSASNSASSNNHHTDSSTANVSAKVPISVVVPPSDNNIDCNNNNSATNPVQESSHISTRLSPRVTMTSPRTICFSTAEGETKKCMRF